MGLKSYLRPGALAPPVEDKDEVTADERQRASVQLEEVPKTFWQKRTPVIACGAGLFADGYLNQVIGPVGTILDTIYGGKYENSIASRDISALAFAGQVVGIIIFGYTSDRYSRKWSLFVSTIILFIFAALSAGSYGAGGSLNGTFAALSAFRFLTGVGIGGEYPAGSVGCAESTGEIESGKRNRWFIWFTNQMIDLGFVVGAIVPMIVVLATGEDHLRAAWRICLGLGVIPPLSLIYMRFKLQEPEAFKQETMSKVKTPWKVIIRLYWFRLIVVSVIWFVYDFSAYAFSLYASTIVDTLTGGPLWKSFGWATLINFFYLPGAFMGSLVSDWIGPRKTLVIGVWAQSLVGFLMAGVYKYLSEPGNIAGFVIVYGVFLSLGELGPGDNIGLCASKTCATAIRGRYYAVAAAMGKIGAFAGAYAFKTIQDDGNTPVEKGQYPFWVASTLAAVSGALAFWCLPEISQDTITNEDIRFRAYLAENGYDTSKIGLESAKPGIDEAARESSSLDGTKTEADAA